MGLACARFVDELPCGEPAELRWGLPLCPQCSYQIWVTMRSGPLHMLREFVDNHLVETRWNYGVTYGLLLPNGKYKIGHVTRPELLNERWQRISRSLGGRVVPLVTEYGGSHLEAYRHAQFISSCYSMSRGEQFDGTMEILEYMRKGHVPAGLRALEQFNQWQPRPGTLAA